MRKKIAKRVVTILILIIVALFHACDGADIPQINNASNTLFHGDHDRFCFENGRLLMIQQSLSSYYKLVLSENTNSKIIARGAFFGNCAIFNDIIYYTFNNSLWSYNLANSKTIRMLGGVKSFVVFDNYIATEEISNLVIRSFEDFKEIGVVENVNTFCGDSNKLYVNNYEREVLEVSIENGTVIKKEIGKTNIKPVADISCCNDTSLVIGGERGISIINLNDYSNQTIEFDFPAEVSVACFNDKVYVSLHRYHGNGSFPYLVDDDNNGLWEIDTRTFVKKIISEKTPKYILIIGDSLLGFDMYWESLISIDLLDKSY